MSSRKSEDSAASPKKRHMDALVEPPEVNHELFVGLSSLRDTLSSSHHSRDFAFAHAHYLRSRVLALRIIFTLLSPPGSSSTLRCRQSCCAIYPVGARGADAGLVGVLVLALFSVERIRRIRFCAGCCWRCRRVLRAGIGDAARHGGAGSGGYGFIPFCWWLLLSVFPLHVAGVVLRWPGHAGAAGLCPDGRRHLDDGAWRRTFGCCRVWWSAWRPTIFSSACCPALSPGDLHESAHRPVQSRSPEVHLEKIQAWQREIEEASNRGRAPCSVLMLDLTILLYQRQPRLPVGDNVLCQFARILSGQTRKHDCVARYG
ncbi:hypothetical protein DSL92_05285 [Billgrantia gudaonensis]|uniref:Uncharacterized protein n=1 Tax=Billgrantia gudaonensis TaxID=376427 RepID=A0A3S0VSS1_9GAMM|nr:hypothetical protein DSL92_05285 [Halomonas gudaonensis]